MQSKINLYEQKILAFVVTHPDSTQSDLVYHTHISLSSVCKILKRLETRKLIQESSSKSFKIYSPTAEGQKVCEVLSTQPGIIIKVKQMEEPKKLRILNKFIKELERIPEDLEEFDEKMKAIFKRS